MARHNNKEKNVISKASAHENNHQATTNHHNNSNAHENLHEKRARAGRKGGLAHHECRGRACSADKGVKKTNNTIF